MTDISPLGCALTPLSHLVAAATELYRYEFEDRSAPLPDALSGIGISAGAYHASELQYLFGVAGYSGAKNFEQQQLSRQMIEYWTNFVKASNPNGPDLPHWPLYNAATRKVMSLRLGTSAVIDNLQASQHCQFWSRVPADLEAPEFSGMTGAVRRGAKNF
jgi:para-nitrobenzyl esterase